MLSNRVKSFSNFFIFNPPPVSPITQCLLTVLQPPCDDSFMNEQQDQDESVPYHQSTTDYTIEQPGQVIQEQATGDTEQVDQLS